MEKKLVKLEFINKRNELKKVQFYMDKQTYEMLMDDSISSEERQKYLVDEYHEYEREKYYKRKIVRLEEEQIDYSLSPEEKCIKNEEEDAFFFFIKGYKKIKSAVEKIKTFPVFVKRVFSSIKPTLSTRAIFSYGSEIYKILPLGSINELTPEFAQRTT